MPRQPRDAAALRAEREVCARVARARRDEGYSLSELASLLGMHRGTLSNYERGKANLSPALALDICRKLDLNPRWLATGAGPRRPFIIPEETGVSPERFLMSRGTFLEAYQRVLGPALESLRGALEGSEKRTRRVSDVVSREYLRRCSVESLLRHVRESSRKLAAADSEEEIFRRRNHLIAVLEEIKTRALKRLGRKVDNMSPDDQHLPLMLGLSSWNDLRNLIVARTQARGTRYALARFLGVSRSAVSKYLAGKSSPSADITLLMLLWVEQEGSKQRSPEGAVTPSEPKTRTRRSSHGKPNSGP